MKEKYSIEVKRKAVEEFISGKKSADEIAKELGYTDSNRIYKWKTLFEENAKIERREELKKEGLSHKDALRVQALELENAELKKALGEKSLMVDLLKKLPTISLLEKESNGLTEIIKELTRKKKLVK